MFFLGNVTISLEEKDEKKLRHFAKTMFSGKKGSMAKVVSRGLQKLERDFEGDLAKQRIIAGMEKGISMGKILIKHRSELYDK